MHSLFNHGEVYEKTLPINISGEIPMPNFLNSSFFTSIENYFQNRKLREKTYEELQQMYEKSFPKLKKQKFGDHLKDVICDASVDDSYFNTNIYPYLGFSKEMNWGYSGSGPQMLALNILFLFSEGDGVFARKFHWDFVNDFLLSKKQSENLTIKAYNIELWIHEKQKRKSATILKLVPNGGQLV